VDAPIEPRGRVINSQLPDGQTVSVTHNGPYDRMHEAYEAIHAQGHDFAGPHWELYGHVRDDAPDATPEIEIVYLLRA
jgi:effector-binding domain-containing protein